MHYVDLQRTFVRINKDQEANLTIGPVWGRRFAGWLDWPDLLEHRRVALLAEALSGKTEEFRHQAKALTDCGKAAFFVRIEDLADEGFEAALDPSAERRFEEWREGTDEAWFFLDSVDEARLNHKSLERALRHFRREINRGLERARVYLSCRVWDWDWRGRGDREKIERWLPVWETPFPPACENDDAELLDPIFKDPYATHAGLTVSDPESKPDALLVVQLVPLDAGQRRLLAAAAGIERSDAFVEDIERNGLHHLTERPGDLIDLAEYWKTHGRFGSLAEMTEHGITRKLEELDNHRPDNRELAPEKARQGVERLAAALTLAKTFTLRAPNHDPDPTLAAGALDPADVLKDWTAAERNALMRRGIFAPSTYGRIRFHSRRTQEYLTACWLDRLLQTGCPRTAVWDLVFAELYGIKTLVPSLHAATAWLALWHPDIRDEIIRREPLALLRQGDPSSLPLQVKEQLLHHYATRHAAGEVSDGLLDQRAMRLFATPDLANAIRRCWNLNNREYFRITLLGFIREGAIQKCSRLARNVALDESRGDYQRIAALEALVACGDTEGLVKAARWLKSASTRIGARLSSSFAKALFPRQLTADELLDIVETSPAPRHGSTESFGYVALDLWKGCSDSSARDRFMAGIADLVLSPPFKSADERISSRHYELAKSLAPFARTAVQELGHRSGASKALVRLLMAVERAGRISALPGERPLTSLVSENASLNRKLFWADVEEMRQNARRYSPTNFRCLYFGGGRCLWKLGSEDLAWLLEDLSGVIKEDDSRMALSAIISILRDSGGLDTEVPRIRELVSGRSALERDLDDHLAPLILDEESMRLDRQLRREERRLQRSQDKERREEEAFWIGLRDELKPNPSLLSDHTHLAVWSAGASKLYHLTHWISCKTGEGSHQAALQWRLLEEAFGRPVAEAYRDGMKILWRITSPERPKRKKNGLVSRKHTAALSFSGIGVEAAEDPDWASRLTPAEAGHAALHACLSEEGYPLWLADLISRHAATVLPILRKALQDEWRGRHGGGLYFWPYYSHSEGPIPDSIQDILFAATTDTRVVSTYVLDQGLRVLQRLDLSAERRQRVAAIALRRLRATRTGGENEYASRYLGMLFIGDADMGVHELSDWLSQTPPASRDALAENLLGELFGQHSALSARVLDSASVNSLEALVRVAHRHVRLEDDRVHEGISRFNSRDNAERARSMLFRALLDRPGADAYHTVKNLATDRVFGGFGIRLSEFAHGKAEHDAEPPSWTSANVLAFEQQHTAPTNTGGVLLRVVLGVLSDIQASFNGADASSRVLLARAESEREVQEWLAEQMNLRSRGRFHAHREAQVARSDKPDVIVSSTAALVEVAVEIKHGGKTWTVRKLERSLTKQLAQDYLRPETRRHGVLVVSHHGRRTWREPKTRAVLSFREVIKRLQACAMETVKNDLGRVEVHVFGIDASRPD